ncbi:hypothetical protein [Bacillus sp. 1P06AnD]|uniref:hypothetical protein n=1 Tax=Bacillus sp. 1P06AnD TaxID=3132208 RepID=UPI0039A30897
MRLKEKDLSMEEKAKRYDELQSWWWWFERRNYLLNESLYKTFTKGIEKYFIPLEDKFK